MEASDPGLDALSRLILALHRGADAQCGEDFRLWAMRQLQKELAFDSGIWADGLIENGVPQIQSVYLHNRPTQMLVDYETVKDQDVLLQASVLNPGRAVAMESRKIDASEVLAAYLHKWQLLQIMSVISTDPLTGLLTSISAWRDDADRPFSEADRGLFEQACPHLIDAYGTNRIGALVRATLPANVDSYSCAAADTAGCLQVAARSFAQLLHNEWPDWQGPLVPPDLQHLVQTQTGARHVGRRIFARSVRAGDAVLLQARPKQPADELTVRESQIAEAFARGLTAKQAARELGISHQTIRTHLAVMFKKLNVKNQTQMVWAIRSAR